MKKVFVFSLFVVISFYACAQKVLIDKPDSDGRRYIATEYRGFSLCCYAGSSDTTWALSYYLNEKCEIDEGRKLLIKLSDDQIITLENAKKIGPLDYESDYYSGRMHYIVYPFYYIEKDDLLSIISKGMVKVRVETNIDLIDWDEKRCKRVTESLIKEYKNISDLLQVKKDLYSDF